MRLSRYLSPFFAVYTMRAACSLMVMPLSRSRSMLSSTCSFMSRSDTALVNSSSRSAKVDLPWSMCAMMQKFRMFSRGNSPTRSIAR
eukprot:scaffold743_cov267-Pinguiococcus_pyrenoidosus.AAC.26